MCSSFCNIVNYNTNIILSISVNIQICRNLIIITGVRFISGNICFGNHAHLQEGAENKCMIIQNSLLHLYSKFGPFLYIKFRAQFFFQIIQFFTAVFSLILVASEVANTVNQYSGSPVGA